MKVSDYEMKMLAIIRDEVDAFLKSRNFGKVPERSNIIKTISYILPKITPGMTFDVRINNSSRDPFILAIYPDINELDKKSEELVQILDDPKSNNEDYVKAWSEIKHWILEIDVRILIEGSPIRVRTGSEFVALLMHEIGHVMVGDPTALIYRYKKKKAMMSKFDKMVASKSRFVRKMLLPLFINTLSFRIVNKGENSLHKEISADGYVPDEYRGSLLSYVDDCILKDPTARCVISTDADYEHDQELSIRFSKESVSMMRDRMDILKKQLAAQFNGCTGSEYHKDMVKFISKSIAAYDPSTDKSNVIVENSLHEKYESEILECAEASEAVLESTKVTDRDLAILEVQCEEVKTTEDKIYLIHTIYDFIEAITKENNAKLKKTKDPSVREFIKNDTRLTRLDNCRKAVMSKDTDDVGDQYGVFVKYPKGYEG